VVARLDRAIQSLPPNGSIEATAIRRLHTSACRFAIGGERQSFQPCAREIAMAKGQMRSNKEKKKPKADKNLKKGGAAPSPFASGKTPAGQSPNSKKS
jgi:hypothetical protein